MCEQPDDGCHGTTYEMASLCLLLNSFSFLGAHVGHTKKPTHDITVVVGFTSRSLQSRWPGRERHYTKRRAYLHSHPKRVDPFFRLQIIAPTVLAGPHSLEQAQYDGLSVSARYQTSYNRTKVSVAKMMMEAFGRLSHN